MSSRETAPTLVRLGLWGIKSKGVAMLFLIGSIVAIGIFAFLRMFDLALIGVLVAAWYGYSIYWVERNGGWTGWK